MYRFKLECQIAQEIDDNEGFNLNHSSFVCIANHEQYKLN